MDTWILLSLTTVTIAIYYYCFKGLDFFKKNGILHVLPLPLVGNMGPIFFRQLSVAEIVQKTYNLNKDAKYVGFFDIMTPVLVIRDPALIKSIAIKNFEMFINRRGVVDEVTDPLFGKNLPSLRDERWRDVRSLLTPAFTSSKMKAMFKLMTDYAANFADFLSRTPSDKNILELKDAFTRYTNDVIATCAFGINVDSMRNRDNKFYVYGRAATTFNTIRTIKFFFVRNMPMLSRIIGIKIIDDDISRFFRDTIAKTIQTRDKENIVRPDMLQLMMETRGKRGPGRELTVGDMTSQAFIFFFGGFESTATCMCFAAHEIAVNPNVQVKLREEIDEALKTSKGVITYELVNGMQYLDAVINETLRLYPVAQFVDRRCKEDFELPPALPGDRPFIVKKGMIIWFPIFGLHRDPRYFEDPDKFCPERFLHDNIKNTNSEAYIPFGLGPRMCIGNRFALLEIKVLLFHLLARCELLPCEKTTYPMRLSKKQFGMLAEGGFWLKIQAKRDVHTI